MNYIQTQKYLQSKGIYKGVVIGSMAYKPLYRSDSDIDIIVKIDDLPDGVDGNNKDIVSIDGETKIEIHILKPKSSLEAVYQASYSFDGSGDDIIFADIRVLYAIKSGHVQRKLIKWDKHMYHYHILREACLIEYGRKFNESMVGFITVDNLIHYTKKHNEEIHGKEFNVPLKNVTKNQFFTDGVTKYIEHDYLHEVFAHYDKPIYTMLQANNIDSVFCHREKWNSLSHIDKCLCVLEESYVIASERFIIPKMVNVKYFNINTVNPCLHVVDALKMVCTTLTSGYFRQFAIDNYYEIIKNIDFDYYTKLVPVIDSYNSGTLERLA